MKRFSEEFLLGAATAAHQVEGNNIHSDYWLMEHMAHTEFSEPSGNAVEHYTRYEEDIRMMKKAGLNAYRFSIEWARIEPEEGKFSEEETLHYRKMIEFILSLDMTPIVTLYHFTSPAWLIKNGGWEDEKTIASFEKYAAYIAEKLGDLLSYVVTINEANMGIQVAAIAERYKRQMMAKMQQMQKMQSENLEGTAQIGMNFNTMMQNMMFKKQENAEVFGTEDPKTFVSARTPEGDRLVCRAHQAAAKVLKEKCPQVKVGLSLSLHDIQALPGGEANAEKEWNDEFSHYLPYIREDDFLGVQNYTRSLIDENGILPVPEGHETTQMDYEFYPEGLSHVLKRVDTELKENGIIMDLIVTENGIASADDERRVAYIDKATAGVAECITAGIPVRGYMYWSLLDNFEWQKGFSMTFGLISVDRETMKRTEKPSLFYLGAMR